MTNITTKGAMGLAAIGLLAGSAIVITTGCTASDPVAVTVNGEAISEQKITDYVQDFRQNNQLEADADWAQWLVDQGRDAKSLREDAIEYYVRNTVIEQEAKSKGIEISDDDITNQLNEIKEYYGYDDNQLHEQIEQIGYTDESYREYIKEQLLQEKLSAAIAEEQGDSAVSDEDILSQINVYSSVLDGAKNIKCIVMSKNDAEKAAQVREQAAAPGADFDKIAEENTVSTENDGWDCLVTQDQAVANELPNIQKDGVSGVIDGADYLYIVKVLDVCTVPESGTFESLDQVPKALQSEFAENVKNTNQSNNFESYVQDLIESADVQKNDMPQGLPYDVSLEGIEPSPDSAGASEEGDEDVEVDEEGSEDEEVVDDEEPSEEDDAAEDAAAEDAGAESGEEGGEAQNPGAAQ